jgi:hypothetical protein
VTGSLATRLSIGLVALSFLVAYPSAAGAASAPTALCAVGQGTAQPCSSTAWYAAPVTLSWSANGSNLSETDCQSYTYNQDTNESALSSPWNQCDFWYYVGTQRITGTVTTSIDVEASTPVVSATPSRPPDANGWYNHPVSVSFGGVAFSGIASCSSPQTYGGPDTPATVLTGSCFDNAGKSAVGGYPLQYDATPPSVTATPSRPPNANGWYDRPVSVSFSGSALSGIASCTAAKTYSGRSTTGTAMTGTCTDNAGLTSAPATYVVQYDATAPTVDLTTDTGDQSIGVSWSASSAPAPLQSIRLTRTPGIGTAATSVVYMGSSDGYRDTHVVNGTRYRYTLTATDVAGNITERSVSVTPSARLLTPTAGAAVSAPVKLTWTAVPGATYYNVQLYRGSKILSSWPAHASLKLTPTWSYYGRRHWLSPGRYRWYVWPGFGSRTRARYGAEIGSGTFVVR